MPSLLMLSMHFFIDMAVILVVYRLLWPLLRRLGQVEVVAIMVAGFLLGPSLLGLVWPQAQNWLFPTTLAVGGTTITHPSLVIIYVVGQLGLLLYMFGVGASFQTHIFARHLRQAGATSLAGIVAPMLLGGTLGWLLVGQRGYFTAGVSHWQGALFLAAAVAVTAFPILAWIVYDSGLVNTRVGTMVLACAASDDACAWMLLATVVATTKGSAAGVVLAVGGGLGYLLFMLLVGRRLLRRLDTWARRTPGGDSSDSGRAVPVGPLSATLLVVLLGGAFTDAVGIHSVVGAFIAGVVMPRGRLLDVINERIEPLVAHLLLPAFFIYAGLNTKLSLIFEPSVLLMTLAVLAVSFAGKFGAVGLAARWQGMSWREAGSMGALANARGLMELILINVGLTMGIVSPALYTILAIMTIVTTIAATPLHRFFERSAWKAGMVYGPAGETAAPAPVVAPPGGRPSPS